MVELIGKLVVGILGILLTITLLAIIFGLPVMLLWNWLMPTIFSLKTITFGQAVGLVFLCGFLFKSSSGSN